MLLGPWGPEWPADTLELLCCEASRHHYRNKCDGREGKREKWSSACTEEKDWTGDTMDGGSMPQWYPQEAILMRVAFATFWDHIEARGLCNHWGPWEGQWSWYSQGPSWCLWPLLPLKTMQIPRVRVAAWISGSRELALPFGVKQAAMLLVPLGELFLPQQES